MRHPSAAMFVAALALCSPGNSSAQTFADVPTDYWAYTFIESLVASSITSGCGGGNYCPEATVTRAQMAVFLERGVNGGDFVPPPASGNVFLDVGPTDFAAAFIEQLFADGISGGCGNDNYCPNGPVTRAQMAVFLLRARFGPGFAPPPATGQFADVPPGSFAAEWIEALAAEGITSGCGGGNFCPGNSVTRAQMAVFLVRTFDLPDATDPSSLRILSPQGPATVDANAITVHVEDEDASAVAIQNVSVGISVDVVQQSGSVDPQTFYGFNVPLRAGLNEIVATSTYPDGSEASEEVLITVRTPRSLVRITSTPAVSDTSPTIVEFQADYSGPGTPTEILSDFDGDGVLDAREPFSPLSSNQYALRGRYSPNFVIATDAGLLFSSNPAQLRSIDVLEPSLPDPAQAITNAGTAPNDIVYVFAAVGTPVGDLSQEVFVLSSIDQAIRQFDSAGGLVRTINLFGNTTVSGFDIDDRANLYVADAGSHQISIYSSEFSYSPGTVFGGPGSDQGELSAPADVAVGRIGGALKIFVADTGNSRIQRFDGLGRFELAFDGGTTADGPLVAPRAIELSAYSELYVLESERIRIFDIDGNQLLAFGSAGSAPGQLSNPSNLSIDPRSGNLVVSDTGNNRIQILRPSGAVQRVVSLTSLAPTSAVIDVEPRGERALVVDSAGNDVTVIPLLADPADEAPVQVLTRYLASLAAQDLAGAQALAGPSVAVALDALAGDAAARAEVASVAAATGSLVLQRQDANTSVVTGAIDAGNGDEPIEFVLERNESSGGWQLATF